MDIPGAENQYVEFKSEYDLVPLQPATAADLDFSAIEAYFSRYHISFARNPRPIKSEPQPTLLTDRCGGGATMWTPNPFFYRFHVHLPGHARNGSMSPHGS